MSHTDKEPVPAPVIVADIGGTNARSASCCTATVQHFLSILGSTAGDIALAHGATGGVYLAGGILPRITGLLHASNFLQRFVDKGPMSGYLVRIPVQVITAPHIALLGAASLYREARAAALPPTPGTPE